MNGIILAALISGMAVHAEEGKFIQQDSIESIKTLCLSYKLPVMSFERNDEGQIIVVKCAPQGI